MKSYISGDQVEIPEIKDHRGALVSMEAMKNIPFEIKRVYFLYDLNDESRGYHSHKNLEQVMFCLSGSLTLELESSQGKSVHSLNSTNKGIYIGSNTWRVMKSFSPGTVVAVFASEHYDESDYIRDYKEFLGGL